MCGYLISLFYLWHLLHYSFTATGIIEYCESVISQVAFFGIYESLSVD